MIIDLIDNLAIDLSINHFNQGMMKFVYHWNLSYPDVLYELYAS